MKKSMKFLLDIVGICIVCCLLNFIFGREQVWYDIIIQGVVVAAVIHVLDYVGDRVTKK